MLRAPPIRAPQQVGARGGRAQSLALGAPERAELHGVVERGRRPAGGPAHAERGVGTYLVHF